MKRKYAYVTLTKKIVEGKLEIAEQQSDVEFTSMHDALNAVGTKLLEFISPPDVKCNVIVTKYEDEYCLSVCPKGVPEEEWLISYVIRKIA